MKRQHKTEDESAAGPKLKKLSLKEGRFYMDDKLVNITPLELVAIMTRCWGEEDEREDIMAREDLIARIEENRPKGADAFYCGKPGHHGKSWRCAVGSSHPDLYFNPVLYVKLEQVACAQLYFEPYSERHSDLDAREYDVRL